MSTKLRQFIKLYNYLKSRKIIYDNLFLLPLQATEAFLERSRTFLARLFCQQKISNS